MKPRATTWMLILLGCAGAASAQNEAACPRPLTGEQWVSRLDGDGDGQVSAQEFDGPAEFFTRLDRDGDGQLGPEEAPPGPPPPPPPPPPGLRGDPKHPRHGPARPPRPPQSFIERLDQDRDGQVSAAEFDGPAEHFGDFDRDGDGFIAAAEAPQGPPPGCPPPPPRRSH